MIVYDPTKPEQSPYIRNRMGEIEGIVREFEMTHGVRVAYVAVTGEHAEGLATGESPIDLAMIYVRPQDDYLTCFEVPRTHTIDSAGIGCVAYDIAHVYEKIANSDTRTLEWLRATPLKSLTDDVVAQTTLSLAARATITARLVNYYYMLSRTRGLPDMLDRTTRHTIEKSMRVAIHTLSLAYVYRFHTMPPVIGRLLVDELSAWRLDDDSPLERLCAITVGLMDAKMEGHGDDTDEHVRDTAHVVKAVLDMLIDENSDISSIVPTTEARKKHTAEMQRLCDEAFRAIVCRVETKTRDSDARESLVEGLDQVIDALSKLREGIKKDGD